MSASLLNPFVIGVLSAAVLVLYNVCLHYLNFGIIFQFLSNNVVSKAVSLDVTDCTDLIFRHATALSVQLRP